ncbi:hypothetical protein Tco_1563127 [Tanacetum coccineum]
MSAVQNTLGKEQTSQELARPASDASLREPHNTPSQGHRAEEGTSEKGSDLDVSVEHPEALSQGAVDLNPRGKEFRKEKRCSKD